MLVLVRHGERADDSQAEAPPYPPPDFDPPLTSKGRQQAFKSGQVLKHSLKPTSVRILSSPFLRCLETAINIAKGLGTASEIEVDWTLSQYMSSHFFQTWEKEGSPLDGLRISIDHQLPDNLEAKLKILDTKRPQFPETLGACQARYRARLQALLEQASGSAGIVIAVSHGFSVEEMLHIFHPAKSYISVDYCSISLAVKSENGSWNLKIASDASHVGLAKSETIS